MMIEHQGDTDLFTASTGDWICYARKVGNAIYLNLASNTGSMEFSSGINFDNLASFISEIKSECIANGFNWSGE
jgi:hypothetical protein